MQYGQDKLLRPTHPRVQGPGTGTAVGTTIMPGTNNALGFSKKLVSGMAADQNGDTKGFDMLDGGRHGRRGN